MLTQEALGVVDGHPINAWSPLVFSIALPRAHEVLSLAHFLHQLHRCSRVFGCCHRHDRFDPRIADSWGFTPPCRCLGQLSLGVLPRSVHEMPVLLAAPNRSGLRPSFPVRAYPLLRLSAWSASLALPTPRPTTPSADSCATVGSPLDFPSSNNTGTTEQWRRPPQVSSIAFAAPLSDLQPWPLMELDFAIRCPLVRPRMPRIRFLFVRSRFCSTLPSDAASRRRPCASLILHLHQVG